MRAFSNTWSMSTLPAVLAICFALTSCISTVTTPKVPPANTAPVSSVQPRRVVWVQFENERVSTAWRKVWESVASREEGWDVWMGFGPSGDSHVSLLFIPLEQRTAPLSILSSLIAALSIGLIPGYGRGTIPVEMHVESRQDGKPVKQAVLTSEFIEHQFVWLPFAVRSPETMKNERIRRQTEGQEAVVRDLLWKARAFLAAP